MTEPLVQETLHRVRDSVAVPQIDHDAFHRRTRQLRRRRRGVQAVGVGAVSVMLAAGVHLHGLTDQPDTTVAAAPDTYGAPIVLDGRIQLLRDDGSVVPTSRVGTPLGLVDGDVVSIDEGVLTGPGGTRVSGVARAFVAPTGVAYQGVDGAIHLPDGRVAANDGDLVAAGESAYVTELNGVLTVHSDGGAGALEAASDGATAEATAVEVGGETVMVASGNTVNFFSVSDGHRESGFLGGTTGALSPDGATYAYAPSADDRADGMRPGLVLYDVEHSRPVRAPMLGDAIDLAWIGTDLLVLTEDPQSRALLTCTGTGCRELLRDDSRTVTLR